MIWMSGLDMGCFYFNRAWLDFRGRTLAQESGNGWAEGVHPDDLERCVNHYVSCFERRIAFAMSYRLQDAAGEYRWILDRGVPHFLPEGQFLGFFGGCAEIDEVAPEKRHAELGRSLAEMREFARRIAAGEDLAARGAQRPQEAALQAFARARQEEHAESLRRRQHAAVELQQLASDMLAYGRIKRGACVA